MLGLAILAVPISCITTQELLTFSEHSMKPHMINTDFANVVRDEIHVLDDDILFSTIAKNVPF